MDPTTNLKLAIIDKDTACLKALISTLEEKVGSISSYTSPEEAIIKMMKDMPDVLIMDVSMPQLNGVSMCEVIRNNDVLKSLPIILISGNKDIGDFTLYFKGVDFLTKPVDPEELLRKVQVYYTLKTAQDKLDYILENLKN
jgi:CheY-like chemotaxis protein